MSNQKNKLAFGFFGTDDFAVNCLRALALNNLWPDLIITTPDKPAGRGRKLTPPPVAHWAQENNLTFIQPNNLKQIPTELKNISADFFLVASYGLKIPQSIYQLPEGRTINIHPSLLPLYRGATPIQTAILNNDLKTGVSLMLIDEKIDHGPILAQAETPVGDKWYQDLEKELADLGITLLIKTLPQYLTKEITPEIQKHEKATFTEKLTKADGLIDPINDPHLAYLKIKALNPWPGTYFFPQPDKRIIIKEASQKDGKLIIEKVLPAGGKLVDWQDFRRSLPAPYNQL